jgi:hypothetical protein
MDVKMDTNTKENERKMVNWETGFLRYLTIILTTGKV